MKKKIAFIIPYPLGFAPSQRFRFEQYLSLIEKEGYELNCYPFLTKTDFELLYENGHLFFKISRIILGFIKRFFLIFTLSKYEIIFIHREATPIGPPVFEWIIAKLLKKKIIYDFDDAIWLTNTSESNWFISKIKNHSKVASICKWSSIVLCGNKYLMSYAKQYNTNVVYIPTTIDTQNLRRKMLISLYR